jgi:hypothetical protein
MTTLFDILQKVKPKRALFTSYTYSSVWFEALLYPFLRKNDCEQITVMLDAREARNSIDNSTSQYGGSRYRIVSTVPAGKGLGIFHPKIAYLESDQGDVFVVGSGNLTVHGQGRSFEVIDAVSARDEPLVFGQIAAFFERLPDRLAMLQQPERDVLDRIARRARAQMERYAGSVTASQSAWLVTTLDDSAGSQLLALARKHISPPASLTVLSPFFDADVGAVVRLHAASGAGKVQYGLARTEEGLIAPFLDNIAGKDRPSLFVVPPNDGRPLHAKWFELTGKAGDALVMTGSVNATQQSLWTTNNIEVALVRRLPATSVGDWKATNEKPLYRACAFPAPVAGPDDIGFVARINRAHVLEVQFSHALPKPAVDLVLHQGEYRLLALRAETDRDNRLTVAMDGKLIQGLRDAALWLTISGEGFEATNWVNIEPHLNLKPARVDLFKSASRVENDSYDEEDMHLLFDAAHVLLTGRKLTRKGKAGTKSSGNEAPEGGERPVSESEWLAAQGSGTRSGDRPAAEAIRIFQAVGKLLEMSDAEVEQILHEGAYPGAGDADDDEDQGRTDAAEPGAGDEAGNDAQVSRDDRKRERQRIEMKKTIPQARSTLQAAIDKRLQQAMPDPLAILIVPIKIRNHLRDGMPRALGGVDEGKEILSGPVPPHMSSSLTGLLSTLAGMKLGPAAVDELLPMVVSSAALVAVCMERRKQTVDRAQIRSWVESFARRELAGADYERMLRDEWRGGRLPRMLRFDIDDLLRQTRLIAGASRLEQRIDDIIALALDDPKRRVTEENPAVLSIIASLRNPLGVKWKLYSVLIADALGDRLGCPQCYGPLNRDEIRNLKSTLMGVCTDRCRRPVFLKTSLSLAHIFVREQQACIRDLRRKPEKEGGTAC